MKNFGKEACQDTTSVFWLNWFLQGKLSTRQNELSLPP
jgi:hypothetical protein